MTVIEADDQLNGVKTYFPTTYQLDMWLEERFRNNAVRIPYALGVERRMIKIRGLVLPKEEVRGFHRKKDRSLREIPLIQYSLLAYVPRHRVHCGE